MQHVFAGLFTCAVPLLHALSQSPILHIWVGVREKVGRMKYWDRNYIILKSLEKSIY